MSENGMTTNTNTPHWTREDVLAWLRRGREIKEQRKKELQEWYAEQQRRKKEDCQRIVFKVSTEKIQIKEREHCSCAMNDHGQCPALKGFTSYITAGKLPENRWKQYDHG